MVSEGRRQSKDDIHKMAQRSCLDRYKSTKERASRQMMGYLNEAIDCAARLASKLDSYKTVEYPATKEPFVRMIEQFTNTDGNNEEMMLKKYFKSLYPAVSCWKMRNRIISNLWWDYHLHWHWIEAGQIIDFPVCHLTAHQILSWWICFWMKDDMSKWNTEIYSSYILKNQMMKH